eukprot:Em0001g3155a
MSSLVSFPTNLTQFSHSLLKSIVPRGTSSGFTRCFWTLPPKRVVPPLKPPISLDATVSEFQRFLSRIAAHKEMRTLRANRSVSQDIVQFKPLRVVPWWPLRSGLTYGAVHQIEEFYRRRLLLLYLILLYLILLYLIVLYLIVLYLIVLYLIVLYLIVLYLILLYLILLYLIVL